MAKSLQELYNERQKLYQSQYAAQQQAAEQAKVAGNATLADTLAQQKQAYQEGVQVASQDSFGRGRQLLNSLAGRGLATSGLTQLGDVQGKIATGKTLSSLAGANAQVKKAGLAGAQNIEQTFANAQRQAELDLAGKSLASDEALTEQTAAEEAANLQKKENVLAAQLELEAAIKSGTLTPEEIQQKISQYEEVYGSLNAAGAMDSSVLSQDMYDQSYGKKFDFFGKLLESFGGPNKESANKVRFNIGGVNKNYANMDEAVAEVNALYAGSPMAGQVVAVAGEGNNSIKFRFGTKLYDTYNQAVAASKA